MDFYIFVSEVFSLSPLHLDVHLNVAYNICQYCPIKDAHITSSDDDDGHCHCHASPNHPHTQVRTHIRTIGAKILLAQRTVCEGEWFKRQRYFKRVDYELNINRHVHIEYRMFVAFMTLEQVLSWMAMREQNYILHTLSPTMSIVYPI